MSDESSSSSRSAKPGGDGSGEERLSPLHWIGPVLFLGAVVGLSFLFWPSGPKWIEPPSPEWREGMRAARELQRTTMVYRDRMQEGSVEGLVTGPIRWNSQALNWKMTYFAEQLTHFDADDFYLVEAEDQFVTILVRSQRQSRGGPEGWYTVDQADTEIFAETFEELLPAGTSIASTAGDPRYYFGSTIDEILDRYPEQTVSPLGTPALSDGENEPDGLATYRLYRTPRLGLAAWPLPTVTEAGDAPEVVRLAIVLPEVDGDGDGDADAAARAFLTAALRDRLARPMAAEEGQP